MKSDSCVFKREEPLTFIALYVDDVILTAENDEVLISTKKSLSTRFQMNDLGPLYHIIGVNCIQDVVNGKIGVTQELYINKLIGTYGLSDANDVSTPLDWMWCL